jgi:hypothetical protein
MEEKRIGIISFAYDPSDAAWPFQVEYGKFPVIGSIRQVKLQMKHIPQSVLDKLDEAATEMIAIADALDYLVEA